MATTDEEFLAGLLDRSLPHQLFDHRGHLRAAWILLQRHPLDDATARICAAIRAYAEHLGATQKFHATLTVALMRLMHARGASERGTTFDDFLAKNADLVTSARALVLRHYSEALLATDAARSGFVDPDRDPLP